jgi:hypothetical protein
MYAYDRDAWLESSVGDKAAVGCVAGQAIGGCEDGSSDGKDENHDGGNEAERIEVLEHHQARRALTRTRSPDSLKMLQKPDVVRAEQRSAWTKGLKSKVVLYIHFFFKRGGRVV